MTRSSRHIIMILGLGGSGLGECYGSGCSKKEDRAVLEKWWFGSGFLGGGFLDVFEVGLGVGLGWGCCGFGARFVLGFGGGF